MKKFIVYFKHFGMNASMKFAAADYTEARRTVDGLLADRGNTCGEHFDILDITNASSALSLVHGEKLPEIPSAGDSPKSALSESVYKR